MRRRGSVLIWLSISSVMEDLPSPVTQAGSPAAAAAHHAVAHDQQAVLVAQHEALDDDAAAFLDRDGVG